MFEVFVITAIFVALAFVGLAIGIIIKGKFPDTHVGHNAEMKKMGVTCAKDDSTLCQGRPDSNTCQGCSLLET